ncbi:transposase [bacterium]|nr:MAG: transposase [bacterium]
MNFNPDIHLRHSIRLQGYDYSSAGAYFIIICTKNRECLFGEIIANEMSLNNFGMIARDEWIKSAAIRSEIELDEFVVMPNHFHGIVVIHGRGDRPVAPTEQCPGPQPKSIGALVAGFKSAVTKHINEIRTTPGLPVWQRNYYEHIVRDDKELNGIREYINNNPMNWETDDEFAGAVI